MFGDCTSSAVYRLALNPTRDGFTGIPQQVATNAGTPADFVPGPDGAIYYAAVGDGEVRRLAAVTTGSDTRVAGGTLTLKDNPSHATQRSISATSADRAIDLGGGPTSADDPTLHGASLRVLSAAGGFDSTYLLPASGWRYIGEPNRATGYQYSDPGRVNGPVTSAFLKAGTLRVAGKGPLAPPRLAPVPHDVSPQPRTLEPYFASPSTRPSRTGCARAQPASPPRRLASRVARWHVKIHCSPCRFSQ